MKFFLSFALIAFSFSSFAARTFRTVPNDPLNTRIYTLDNGLTVFLSQNTIKPRIHSFIATKAGSSYDPKENTGLAHYLEHMLFKGTDKFGTKDWATEKVYLDKISELYDAHKAEKDKTLKKVIYKQIDSISYIASGFAIPNEFDKMMSGMGAADVNAFTSFDHTVYTEDIPNNMLERWAKVESERMHTLVLRLFHTELEAVYEEFNIGQDNDEGKAFDMMMRGLFPSHPYGTQTTIGLGSHLKNPSLTAIHAYFKKYYVPNNMAICLSGDLDFDKTIDIIEKNFSFWEKSTTLTPMVKNIPRATGIKVKEVFGPKEENIMIGYSFGNASSTDVPYMDLLNAMFSNQKAGILDINVVQQQKALSANSWNYSLKDAGLFVLQGTPKEGQTLEQLKDLLLGEIANLKAGKFDDELINAAKKFIKLNRIKSFEKNSDRSYQYVDAFTKNVDWGVYLSQQAFMDKLTKADIVKFANTFFTDDYTIVYKRNGTPKGIYKVDKPTITPVQTNRDAQSPFLLSVSAINPLKNEPKYIDFTKDIKTTKTSSGIPFSYIHNKVNQTFQLYYILDMGTFHNEKLELAAKYLPLLGTDKYSPEQLQLEFFKLGVSMDVSADEEKTFVSLSGLEESLPEAVKLFEHVLTNVKADEKVYQDLVEMMLKERTDAKKDKQNIFWGHLRPYAEYGVKNMSNDVMTADELRLTTGDELVNLIKRLSGFKHRIFYYGSKDIVISNAVVSQHHKTSFALEEYPKPVDYAQLPTTTNQVFFTDYDMVQAEIFMMNRGVGFNRTIVPMSKLFNEYFGGGMSSIVFQEIRESKALAYSAFSSYRNANKREKYNTMFAYIGTQGDKLKTALDAMRGLMNDIPYSEKAFQTAKESVLKGIESDRKVGIEIFWTMEAAKKQGLDYDIRKEIYEKVTTATFEDLRAFYNEHVKNKKYTYCIMGKESALKMDDVKSFGEIKKIKIEELFGY
jgi:zinc protease